MSVFQLKKGQSGIIIRVEAGGAEAARLTALGICCGAKVTALAFSLFNSSILLGVNYSRVSLRRAVAERIEVRPCA